MAGNVSPSVRRLTGQIIAAEATLAPPPDGVDARERYPSVRVVERLCVCLTRFAGADGFAALLRRSLALATVDVPALHGVRIQGNCRLEGIEESGADGVTAVTAHLLSLLVTFIGEALTLRLLREAWPDASFEPMSEDESRHSS